MDFLIKLYTWGIAAELLFHGYAIIMYSFGYKERKIYEANVNKVGLSWDPLYLKVYWIRDFKHTTLRFWTITFFDLLGCLLSWYQVLYRVHKIMKVREVNAMLTPDQKQAAFMLRNNADLTGEDVFQKLKLLDPSLPIKPPGTFVISDDVDASDFYRLFAKALVDEKARELLVPLMEATGMNVTMREIAILKYAIGEEDRESLLKAMQPEQPNTQMSDAEAAVVVRELEILKSLFTNENRS